MHKVGEDTHSVGSQRAGPYDDDDDDDDDDADDDDDDDEDNNIDDIRDDDSVGGQGPVWASIMLVRILIKMTSILINDDDFGHHL